MKKQAITYLVLVVTVLVSLSIPTYAADIVKIGLSAPLTGDNAEYGAMFKRSALLAAEWVNQAGGINGKKLAIVIQDSKGDPREATLIAQKFVDDRQVSAVIGDFTSTSSMAAAPIYERNNLVQLSPTASHPDFAPSGEYIFGIVGTQDGEGPYMADMAVNMLKAKKIAILYNNNDWGIVTKDRFMSAVKKLGAQVTIAEPYFEGNKDFSAALTKLKRTNPDLLFIASMYTDAALISKQRAKMGWDVDVLGPGSLYSSQLIALGGSAVEGFHTNTLFFPESNDPLVKKFVTQFKQRYNVEPNMFAAVAFDSVLLLADTMKKSGTDRKAVQNTLAKTKGWVGVTGKITFTKHGDVVRTYMPLMVEKGKFIILDHNVGHGH